MADKVFFMAADPKHPMFIAAQLEYGNKGPAEMQKMQHQIDHEMLKGHRPQGVWYNGKKNPFLAGMIDGQVYIQGHGMPGFISIEFGRGGERIDYEDVVDRLIKSGLKKEFRGKIKCYNCHSAEAGVVGTDTQIVDGEPFAQKIADTLYARGYRKCTFYGYVGSIDSYAKAGSAGTHKYVRKAGVESGRVSESRVQFNARPVPKKPNIFKRLFGKVA
jgi:hypothetical protein